PDRRGRRRARRRGRAIEEVLRSRHLARQRPLRGLSAAGGGDAVLRRGGAADRIDMIRHLAGRVLGRLRTELWLRGYPPPRRYVRPTDKVQIGVQLHPAHTTWDAYRQAWLRAEELGVDSIWSWDHFFPLYGDPNGDHFEGWTSLAILGAQTKTARV